MSPPPIGIRRSITL